MSVIRSTADAQLASTPVTRAEVGAVVRQAVLPLVATATAQVRNVDITLMTVVHALKKKGLLTSQELETAEAEFLTMMGLVPAQPQRLVETEDLQLAATLTEGR